MSAVDISATMTVIHCLEAEASGIKCPESRCFQIITCVSFA